jgi:hypothetical protein
MVFTSNLVYSETISVVCKLDKGDDRPIPFKFIKNPNGTIQMFRFDKSENRVEKFEGGTSGKSSLVLLEIGESEIKYQTKYEGYSHTSLDVSSPVVPEGESRTGRISKIDGSWNEYYTSYGPWSEITGKFNNQNGKCVNRTENKIK